MSTIEETFTDNQIDALKILVEMIIPASEEHRLPSAAEERIFADILDTAQRQQRAVCEGLSALDVLSRDDEGGMFVALEPAARGRIVETFRRAHGKDADLLATITVQCYYRDGRIMRTLDMETRPPHPLGYDVDEGDWSLLEPVRGRREFYRKAP